MNETTYNALLNQFESAHKLNLVTRFYHSEQYFSVTFNENLHKKTINTVIKLVEYKYHTDVFVIIKDDHTIEIWNKGVAF